MTTLTESHAEPRTLAHRIYLDLRLRILDGRVEPGSRLVVDKLAREFGVSATPIREALRLLEREQFIAFRPHCGATTLTPAARNHADLSEVRAALEPIAARRAAAQLSDKDLLLLDATVAIGRKCLAGEMPLTKWLAADDAFHLLILQRADNPYLRDTLGGLVDRIRLHRAAYFNTKQRVKRSVAEHAAIVKALRSRNADAAAAAMAAHMASHVPSPADSAPTD